MSQGAQVIQFIVVTHKWHVKRTNRTNVSGTPRLNRIGAPLSYAHTRVMLGTPPIKHRHTAPIGEHRSKAHRIKSSWTIRLVLMHRPILTTWMHSELRPSSLSLRTLSFVATSVPDLTVTGCIPSPMASTRNNKLQKEKEICEEWKTNATEKKELRAKIKRNVGHK